MMVFERAREQTIYFAKNIQSGVRGYTWNVRYGWGRRRGRR